MSKDWARWSVVLILASAPVAAHGDETSTNAVAAFGLEGIWSPDCRAPASEANPRVVWRVNRDLSIFHGVTFDDRTWALIDTIADATILRDGKLRFVVIRSGRRFETVTIERYMTTLRTRLAIGVNGEVYVRDGIFTSTGAPVLADKRCELDIPMS
jgi:hypothetical protein